MKVKIGKFPSRISTHNLAEILCFWVPSKPNRFGGMEKPEWVDKFGEWLTFGSVKPEPEPFAQPQPLWINRKTTWLYNMLEWIDEKRTQKISVKIDPWDTWNMDDTLAHIILPMLKQLKSNKQGGPFVDVEDVPAELRPEELTKEQQEQGELDNTHFERWEWILDEMIFAFQSKVDDSWEDQYFTGEADWETRVTEWDDDGKPELFELVEGEGHTMEFDSEGYQQHQARIQRGFELFGKYYSGLWS